MSTTHRYQVVSALLEYRHEQLHVAIGVDICSGASGYEDGTQRIDNKLE